MVTFLETCVAAATLIGKVAVGLIEGVAVTSSTTFWREITEWIKACIKAIKEKNLHSSVYGTKVFLQKVGKKFKRIAEHFSKMKDSDKWLKTTTINDDLVDPEEVPEDIRMKAQAAEEDVVDISQEYEKELKLSNKS